MLISLRRPKTLHVAGEVKDTPFVNLPDAETSRWGGGITAEQMSEMEPVRDGWVTILAFGGSVFAVTVAITQRESLRGVDSGQGAGLVHDAPTDQGSDNTHTPDQQTFCSPADASRANAYARTIGSGCHAPGARLSSRHRRGHLRLRGNDDSLPC